MSYETLGRNRMIETQRCTISRFTQTDILEALPLFTEWKNRIYLGGNQSIDEAMMKLEGYTKRDGYFAVRLKSSNAFIGIVCIENYHNLIDKECSYQFLWQTSGNGYASEVVKAFLNFCRDSLKLSRIVSETQTKNHKSCALLVRLGYQLEGKIMRFHEEQSIYVYRFTEVEGSYTRK